jgi:predicted membrane protein
MNKKKKTQKPRSESKFRSSLFNILNGSFLTRDNVLSYLPFVFFLVFVSVLYITYGYYAESTVKEMYRLEAEVKDMKAQNLTLKSDLEQIKQQSNVAESIKELGLTESVEPPHKIRLEVE